MAYGSFFDAPAVGEAQAAARVEVSGDDEAYFRIAGDPAEYGPIRPHDPPDRILGLFVAGGWSTAEGEIRWEGDTLVIEWMRLTPATDPPSPGQ